MGCEDAVWGEDAQATKERSVREEEPPQIANPKSQIAPAKKRPPFREALGIHRINVLLIFNTSQRIANVLSRISCRIFLIGINIQGHCITIRHNTPEYCV